VIQNFSEISHSLAVLYDSIVVFELKPAIARLYCMTVLSCLILSPESSVEIASITRSCETIALIVSMISCAVNFVGSSSGGSHGLSAKSGSQRLLVLRAAYCSTLNEASPIKSD
jgi:hypothetical protein